MVKYLAYMLLLTIAEGEATVEKPVRTGADMCGRRMGVL